MKAKIVLVPLDGSPLAEQAVERAIRCVADDGRLVLLRAAEAHASPFRDPSEAQVAAVSEAEAYLEGAAMRARGAGANDVQTSVWYSPPVEAIVEAARCRKADLIVMSTHGRTGLGRLVLGSVAESVLRATTVPILLIHPAAPASVTDDFASQVAGV
jgi:nucleotide-binding universal stress UspA family protein